MITTGTVGGEESPSCGPIFSHHNAGPAPPLIESQTTGIHYSSILDGASWGQKLNISNRELFNLAFRLARFANPAGEIWFRIRKWGDLSLIWQKKLCNASEISPTAQWYGLAIDPPIVIDEMVGLETTAGASGSTGNTSIFASPTDVKPNERLYFRHADGTITEYPASDYMYSYNYRPGWDFG